MKTYLESLCQRLSIKISLSQEEKILTYLHCLLNQRQYHNLIGSKEPKNILSLHILDSLYAASVINYQGPCKILDVGTGAGLPGIIFKIYYPETELFLLESQKKKCLFLEDIIKSLSLSKVQIIAERAEKAAQDNKFREKFDVVISRAVAKLNVLAEYCLPFVCLNGYFVAFKGPEITQELEKAKKAINLLGGKLSKIEKYELPVDKFDKEDLHKRQIIIFQKIKSTPDKYPRCIGIPQKRPL